MTLKELQASLAAEMVSFTSQIEDRHRNGILDDLQDFRRDVLWRETK